ncbi:AGL029Wp [Eremothecium gossypii ATCC 10895]|uniref:AGL029Wp n=1 Tax=Eremothecium gossypii (strain ATCC 10895 / CBS 109.51 / FGSC 9923 / NRRL Y-1056) TaxID=284811 RepID=Q750I0_EREGS|nr:AGL029Wp [Eremothecium gossypii ATCC 10895]AAS54461.1 AGL029Wp [Eremothecium gossypii ATCC 10895]AEY98792.1 FAGL029Wp [Eremothecium gossypii FDAG1]
MDFTSDLNSRDSSNGSSAGGRSSSSPAGQLSSGQEFMNDDEIQISNLQETKDALLQQRAKLLALVANRKKELAAVQQRSANARQQQTDAEESLIPKDPGGLLELFTKALNTSTGLAEKRSTRTQINGASQLEEELLNKYDVLPLLNRNLRLAALVRSCPHMRIESANPSDMRIRYLVDYQDEDLFQLHCNIDIDSSTGYVRSFSDVQLISDMPEHTLGLLKEYTIRTGNIAYLLFGCNEYTRLCIRRNAVLSSLQDSACKTIPHLKVVQHSMDLIKFAKNSWQIEVRFDVLFIEERLPFPSSNIQATLYKNGAMMEDVQDILNGLIREYGVKEGILQLIRSLYI